MIPLYPALFTLIITNSIEAFAPTKHENWKYVNDEKCGRSVVSRIIGGTNAALGQMPWLVRIGYTSPFLSAEVSFRCGGAIINDITVLTAAHCVDGLPSGLKVSTLRVGEYNTETNPDCEKKVCADPVQDFKPKEIIIHSDYNKVPFQNDIALIRLQTPIKMNSYVNPICLMYGSLMSQSFLNMTLEIGGWGVYDIDDQKNSKILQVVNLPVVDDSHCKMLYKRHAPIGEKQLCVGGIKKKDSCMGDSGGPLVSLEAVGDEPPKYFIVGIVSFGSKRCGESPMPGIYTKMASYMGWLLNNILHSKIDYRRMES